MKFKEGKIIEIFYVEKNGKKIPIIIRYPKKTDARDVCTFFNKAIKETEFLARITSVSLKDEKKWIDDAIRKIENCDGVQLFAECNGKIVGSCSINRKSEQRQAHIGDMGICILQEFTGLGIGKCMMTVAEKESTNMKLRMLELSVNGKNKVARNMYRKIGFIEAGKIPRAIKTGRGYDNDIKMYKVLKK